MNGDLRSLVSLGSAWLSEFVGSLLATPARVDEGSGVDVAGVNVGRDAVGVGGSWISVGSVGSSSVRLE